MPIVLFLLLTVLLPLTAVTPQHPMVPLIVPQDFEIDEIYYHLKQEDTEEIMRLAIQRREMLKTREEALKKQNEGILRVGILGNSALNYTKEGFNPEALRQLFEEMLAEGPEAVFFIGPFIPPGVSGEAFYDQIKKALGNIPFYPTPDSKEIVEKFKLPVSENFPQGYSVVLKNTLFALFSQAEDSQEQFITWLQDTLQKHDGKYRFLLGPKAAYSTQATEGNFSGLDQRTQFRNQAWNLLRKDNVLAYFASNEILYDRSYRAGVWQFLTGGAGATRTYAVKDDTFYHFILLTIPQDGNSPLVEMFDIRGRKRDSLLLNPQAPAISQFRISVTKN